MGEYGLAEAMLQRQRGVDTDACPSLEAESENIQQQLMATGLPIGHKIPATHGSWCGNTEALMPACVDQHGRIWREDGEGLTLVFDPAISK